MTVRATPLLSALLAICAQPAVSAQLYADFPDRIDPAGRYVIYSHGLIVEGTDPEPIHPEYGKYEFPAIAAALFDGGEFNVIAHHRPANTDVGAYVAQLQGWVQALLDAGVAPGRITLVGFSRGAALTAAAASGFEKTGINTALMAVCLEGVVAGAPQLRIGGNFLSIYEETDVVKSCSGLAQASSELVSFREIAIDTGLRHGAFYRPLRQWLAPLREWIAATNR